MKKLTVLIICLLFCFCSFQTEAIEPTPKKYDFYLEWLVPDRLVRIVGMEFSTENASSLYREVGYGEAFKQAITTLRREYNIMDITAIEYCLGISSAGSLTKELYIITEKKSLIWNKKKEK